MDKIIILDFGSQTTQLIGRRIRQLGVYSLILPGDTPWEQMPKEGLRGIILSGSPSSVYESEAPKPDAAIYRAGIPLLGICYGSQRLIKDAGGTVAPHSQKEYGRAKVFFEKSDPLLMGIDSGFVSWMSHGDSIQELAPSYKMIAQTENGIPAIVRHISLPHWGLQFHPEVTHCEEGMQILANFIFNICQAKADWSMETYFSQIQAQIKKQVGSQKVLLLISGGVDSSVVAALLLKSLDPEQVHLMYIDTGLMRKNESSEVENLLQQLGARHIHHINASQVFLKALRGVKDPEKKRRLIGDLFMRVQAKEVKRLQIPGAFLAQGTLYTDLIESGKGVGQKACVIKSHHNVRSPLVEAKRQAGLIVEPLAELYKDEVRQLGRHLGLPETIIQRHPFPGPGLAVRVIGEVTPAKITLLQEADAIYLEELKKRNLYNQIWQAFCVLLPLRSVGVSGDLRRYGYVLALRAISSVDGMTADVFPLPMADLLEISSRLTNSLREIGRVVYDISSKPPATIEWE